MLNRSGNLSDTCLSHNQAESRETMSEPVLARRAFMSATAMTALSYSRVLGANDRLRLGAIGVGERGRNDMSKFQKNPTVDVAAVCDIYADQIDKAKSMAPQAQTHKDHRKLLEDKSIDVVLI